MAITFAVRGTSKSARFTSAIAAPGEFGTNSVDVADIDHILNLDQASFAEHALIYEARNSLPAAQQFSILLRVAPGDTVNALQMFSIGLPGNRGVIHSRFSGAGTIVSSLIDNTGSTIANQTYTFAYVAGTYYDFVWLVDTSLTTAGMILYRDGTSVVTTNITTRPALPSQAAAYVMLGAQNTAAQNTTRIKVSEFVLWDTIITPTSVALVSGTGSLNGATRNSYVNVSAFEGGVYTDPGIANVKNGTSYTFAGTSETGTLASGGGSYPFCG